MRMRKTLTAIAFVVIAGIAGACGQGEAERPDSLRLIAHDSFAGSVNEETFAAFTAGTGIEVEMIAAGDAGSMVNQAALSAGNPLADVMFGVDDTFLSRALDEDIFVEHQSDLLDDVVTGLRPETRLVTPIDFGDVCLNYDKAWFEENQIAVPDDLDQFRDPAYAALLTVEHPATSSPGLAFLFATIERFGEDGWQQYWGDLRLGGVNVVPNWDTAYYGDFTRYGGPSPIVVSYASSPPAEVVFASEPIEEAPTGVIEAGCYRQVEYAGVLAGTDHPESAGDLIDFMLSVGFQETIPLTWFVFPANRDAELPDVFAENTTIPGQPTRFTPETIAEKRDAWIDEWVAIMEG